MAQQCQGTQSSSTTNASQPSKPIDSSSIAADSTQPQQQQQQQSDDTAATNPEDYNKLPVMQKRFCFVAQPPTDRPYKLTVNLTGKQTTLQSLCRQQVTLCLGV